jgi:hypothetical protein
VRLQLLSPLRLLPPGEMIDTLLPEERSMALWRRQVEECTASECSTGWNGSGKLGDVKDISNWDTHLEATNFQDLVNADHDFKTPEKVRVVSAMQKEEKKDCNEVVEIGSVSPFCIGLTTTTPLEGKQEDLAGKPCSDKDPARMGWAHRKVWN